MGKQYVIFGGIDDFDNQPIFWSNDEGWVTLDEATRFTEHEHETKTYLPTYHKDYATVWVQL